MSLAAFGALCALLFAVAIGLGFLIARAISFCVAGGAPMHEPYAETLRRAGVKPCPCSTCDAARVARTPRGSPSFDAFLSEEALAGIAGGCGNPRETPSPDEKPAP